MRSISLGDLACWQRQAIEFQLIDVREHTEHKTFNIGGQLMPLSEFRAHLHLLDLSKPIVFYCKRGIRSQIAIQRLMMLGVKGDFINLEGGILTLMS